MTINRSINRWPCLFVLLFMAGGLCGESVASRQAEAAVVGWLKTDPAPLGARIGQTVRKTETYKGNDGLPLYHVVYLDPQGFVIVAGDDGVEPIVAFVSDGTYDPSDANPLGALVSADLRGRVEAARGAGTLQAVQLAGASQTKWQTLLRAEEALQDGTLSLTSVSDLRVAPFVKSAWNQTYAGSTGCYNYYTPPYDDGAKTNYPCGCVATAMSQLMRYWQYPKAGVGTTSFTISTNSVYFSRSLRGGDGAGGAYDWGNMSLTNGSSTTTAQRQAIGALCHDAGVSVNMDYTSGGSGTDTLKAKTAFCSTFKYSNAIKGYRSGNNIGAGLTGMANPNLDASCPVIFGITGSGGHAIVCDGYGYNLSTLYHHLNMGWSGSSDAWYELPNIGSFTSVYKCVYNVWTNGTGEIISGRIVDASGNPVVGVSVTATRAAGGSYSATTDARGIYALSRLPSASQYTVSAVKAGYSFVPQTVSTGTSTDNASSSGNLWGVDFALDDSANPQAFQAAATRPTAIRLDWTPNASYGSVMVAWGTNDTFGVPSGNYAAGDSVSGGGTVLYVGGATNATHSGLSSNVCYYYKIWSVMSGPAYSSGRTASATTPFGVPFSEGFENAGAIPSGWTQLYVTNAADWTFQTGGYSSNPSASHGGSYNAFLYSASSSDHKTLLITPRLCFGNRILNAQLTFWHCMTVWGGDQDQLRVYYRTSSAGTWNLLTAYTNSVASWTQRTLSLPEVSDAFYIGFEGNAKYGYGVCVDDVAVTADLPPADSFMAWSQANCPGEAFAAAFAADRDGDGVANGFEYAFGTNWGAGTLLLNMVTLSGMPAVEIPRQPSATRPYVDVALEMTRSLISPDWTTNGIQSVDDVSEPANRAWFQSSSLATNGYFRLRGALK